MLVIIHVIISDKMENLSETYLSDILLDRFDYKSDEVFNTVKELMELSDEGKRILNCYLETGVLPSNERNGLSLQKMRKQASSETTDIALIIIYDGIQRKVTEISMV